MTAIDDNDTEQTGFMAMKVEKQPVAKKNFRIMTLQYNSNVLGGHCIRYAVQESHGAGYGYTIFDSIRIPDMIPENVLSTIFRPHG